MARRVRSSAIDNRSSRLKLPVSKKPHHYTTVAPGIAVAYRRCQGAGRWVVRAADGKGGNWQKVIGTADDFEDANGESVLSFFEASDRARSIARGTDAETGRPVTVAEALEDYQRDLKTRGGDVGNAGRVRGHLTPALLSKPVAMLQPRELRRWRDGLGEAIGAATINRTAKALKAALHLAAAHDQRITNAAAWRVGLAGLPGTHNPRNAILSDKEVIALISAANGEDATFGLLVEVAAVTGSRLSQVARLQVADLQGDRADPRLMMPTSRKGRGRKPGKISVPITATVAVRLREAAGTRKGDEPLLLKADGTTWGRNDHLRPFAAAAVRAGLVGHTFYSLRHSYVVRSILAGQPLRVIAANCDTSTAMLEATYSKFISGHSDTVGRQGLLETGPGPDAKVLKLPRRKGG